jgi:hypothetical protein
MERRSLGYSAAALAWLLPACATMAQAPRAQVRTISYETGPCSSLPCSEYRLEINSDGTGEFYTRLRAEAQVRRAFTATPQQFRDFAARLDPARPARGEVRLAPPNCQTNATDMSSVDINWTMADGSTRALYLDYGCDMAKHRALANRLRSAPAALLSEILPPAR